MNTRTYRPIPLALTGLIALFSALVALAISGGHDAAAHGNSHDATPATTVSTSELALRQGMNKLWEDHVTWTRLAVISLTTGSPDTQATVARLLRNQTDIGNAIKPFYGKAAGNELTKLLTEHIQLAVPVLVAAKKGDSDALDTAVADWYANARQVGSFLAKANPAWKGARKMLKVHITQTVAYASDQLQGDYAKSIADYDEAEEHMLMLADQLSAGIIEEFPGRFR